VLETQEFGNFSNKKLGSGLTIDDFELLKVIGKGSFGKVIQVRKKDSKRIYAMKVLKKAQLVKRKQVAHTKTERKVMEDIDNPFIVGLRFAFQTSEKLYMVLDYFTGGELFFHLKNGGKFTEDRAKFYAAEIAIALQCLHDHQIVYRDLKPENVLLDENGHIRLTDFGLSKEGISTTKLTHTFCGTPEYLAPEVIHGQGYGTPVDWWSLGTLLYEMLTGLPPFYNQNLHVMYEKIIRGKLHFPAELSNEARALLGALLERNPKLRLCTRGGIDELIKHPFFASLDFEKLKKKQITPPFKPESREGKLDVVNVDDEFKKETPKDTPVMASTLTSQADFPEFTYKGAESMAPKQSIDMKMVDSHDPFAKFENSSKPLRFEDVDRDSPDEMDAPIRYNHRASGVFKH
jgi:serum/glucocorticoid-regulated kinase 2